LCGATGSHDYNRPRNALGGSMQTNIQATWKTGEVVVDVVLTAHHKVCSLSFMDAILSVASNQLL
jgi:hypothetical protein